MGNNRKGGLKAAETNIKRYGPDFYKKIGRLGGAKGTGGGFASMSREERQAAGHKGGTNSWAKLTPKQRTARGRKIWDTIRKREAL